MPKMWLIGRFWDGEFLGPLFLIKKYLSGICAALRDFWIFCKKGLILAEVRGRIGIADKEA